MDPIVIEGGDGQEDEEEEEEKVDDNNDAALDAEAAKAAVLLSRSFASKMLLARAVSRRRCRTSPRVAWGDFVGAPAGDALRVVEVGEPRKRESSIEEDEDNKEDDDKDEKETSAACRRL